jgi:FeS assembly protein IscX
MRWDETELIIESLEEHYPDVDIEEISLSDIYDLILDLQDFSDDPDAVEESTLKKIREGWSEFRADM